MTKYAAPMCMTCKHLASEARGMECAAFLDGIPDAIISSAFDHRQPYPGDRGIRYELIPGKEPLGLAEEPLSEL